MKPTRTETKAAPTVEFQLIPTDRIIPSDDNPRTVDTRCQEFRDLVKSIAAVGIIEPLVVRPHPTKKGCFDLRAGERRLRAAIEARVETVPCVVRGMDDGEAQAVTVTENMHRQELTPLEEADGVAALLEANRSVEEIAAQLGRSAKWVRRRASLVSLSEAWKRLLAGGKSHLSRWPAAWLEFVSRMPANVQDELLKEFAEDAWRSPKSLGELRKRMEEFEHQLSAAPWDLASTDFGRPSCHDCPKRSGANPDLFDTPKNDRCLDRQCWSMRVVAWLKAQYRAAVKEHGHVAMVAGKQGDAYDAQRIFGDGQKVLNAWDYETCKPAEKGAKTAFVACGERAGSLITIKPRERENGIPAARSGPKTMAEKKAQLERVRGKVACELLSEKLADASHTVDEVIALAAVFGTRERLDSPGSAGTAQQTPRERWECKTPSWDAYAVVLKESGAAALWAAVVPVLRKRIDTRMVKEPPMKEAEALAQALRIDLGPLRAEAERRKPVPKAWAREEIIVKKEAA